eukprot:288805-Pelagomonas_calceolata.AAC.3
MSKHYDMQKPKQNRNCSAKVSAVCASFGQLPQKSCGITCSCTSGLLLETCRVCWEPWVAPPPLLSAPLLAGEVPKTGSTPVISVAARLVKVDAYGSKGKDRAGGYRSKWVGQQGRTGQEQVGRLARKDRASGRTPHACKTWPGRGSTHPWEDDPFSRLFFSGASQKHTELLSVVCLEYLESPGQEWKRRLLRMTIPAPPLCAAAPLSAHDGTLAPQPFPPQASTAQSRSGCNGKDTSARMSWQGWSYGLKAYLTCGMWTSLSHDG